MKTVFTVICIMLLANLSCSEKSVPVKEPVSENTEKPSLTNTTAELPDALNIDSSPRELPPGWDELKFCEGVAFLAADHAEKSTTASVLIGDKAYLFRSEYQRFKPADLGRKIKVTGTIVEDRLPLFILPPDHTGVVPAGIAMPPGTDLEKESRYYFIQNPRWEFIP